MRSGWFCYYNYFCSHFLVTCLRVLQKKLKKHDHRVRFYEPTEESGPIVQKWILPIGWQQLIPNQKHAVMLERAPPTRYSGIIAHFRLKLTTCYLQGDYPGTRSTSQTPVNYYDIIHQSNSSVCTSQWDIENPWLFDGSSSVAITYFAWHRRQLTASRAEEAQYWISPSNSS